MWACIPEFPVSLLRGDDDGVLFAPLGNFEREVRRAFPPERPPSQTPGRDVKTNDSYARSADIDSRQLRETLEAAGVEPSTRDRVMRDYTEARRLLADVRRASREERDQDDGRPDLPVVMPDLPDCVPEEFRLYLRGMVDHTRGDRADAIDAWKKLLDLPEPKRRLRSVWASYMIGRSLVDDQPEQATAWLQRARSLAKAGFPDPLDLHTESLGWEALAELNRQRHAEALRLYLAQHRAGNPGAMQSLRIAAHRALQRADPRELRQLAESEATRRVMTAFALEQYSVARCWMHLESQPDIEPWLEALETLPDKSLPDADRIAWLLYQQGRYEPARRWVNLADRASPLSAWIDGKLLLRDGRIDAGTARFADAVHGFSRLECWDDVAGGPFPWDGFRPRDRASAELAVLRLSRGNFDEALRLFLDGDYWLDAAYLAERVMTLDELRRFVDARRPRDPWQALLRWPSDAAHAPLRQLLARRLIRAERFDEARAYLDPAYHAALTELADGLAIGRDENRRLEQRAEGYVRAARALRHHGLELVGYELDPDWVVYGGGFEDEPVGPGREPVNLVAPAHGSELARQRDNAPRSNKRWHYRYAAADLMWEACYLLPNDSEKTAELLREGGMWLAPRDPQAADRFYKALVRRCGNTALGRDADRLRWFPPKPATPR